MKLFDNGKSPTRKEQLIPQLKNSFIRVAPAIIGSVCFDMKSRAYSGVILWYMEINVCSNSGDWEHIIEPIINLERKEISAFFLRVYKVLRLRIF